MQTRLFGIALSAWLAFACSGDERPNTQGDDAGRSSQAGNAGTAGTPATGGSQGGSGGATGTATGGTLGGAVQAGGATATGGAPATGGAAGTSNSGGGSTGGAATGGTGADAGSSAAAGSSTGGTDAAGAGGTESGGAAGAAAGSANQGGTAGSAPATSLYQKYAALFPMGAAVNSGSYTSHAAVLTKHFNSITPENEMKFESLQPSEGRFTYDAADRIVAFATQNNMKIRGHALVWHTQNPSWLFTNSSGGQASRETLLARMRSHISTVMRHFQGKVYAWDVVNEAMMEDGGYRTQNEESDKQSKWYQILGEDYIAEAFRAAHEADPNAKLFYNDFYNYIPAKQQGIYNMLKGLLEQGVVVHGVGLQCHLNIEPSTNPSNQAYYQNVANLEDAIKLYESLGLEVQVTELDLSLYIPGMTYTSDQFYTPATFTDALQTKQAERYRAFFELFRRYAGTITGVTFWGIADDNTWLSEFSSRRQDFPLLFDTMHNPKKAYYSVVDF